VQPDDKVNDRRVDQKGRQKSRKAAQMLVELGIFKSQEKGGHYCSRGRQ
jgi:phosphohistidine phosphatase SixA